MNDFLKTFMRSVETGLSGLIIALLIVLALVNLVS